MADEKVAEIELFINVNGTVLSPWWSEEISGYLCALCGCRDSGQCDLCLNKNKWCG